MTPQIVTLVRHGQAHHNVSEAYHLNDPYLTPLGESQCMALPTRFPTTPPIDLLVTSPLKRTLQTTILGFPDAIATGAPIIALPQLQETSALPCDTGSPSSDLLADPRITSTADGSPVSVDFSRLDEGWEEKTGANAPEPEALRERGRWVKKWLRGRNERHVVCVLHGGFLHYLTDDWTGSNDLPGTGWENTEFRNFCWEDGEVDRLVETRESRERRKERPLGRTEMRQFLESHVKN